MNPKKINPSKKLKSWKTKTNSNFYQICMNQLNICQFFESNKKKIFCIFISKSIGIQKVRFLYNSIFLWIYGPVDIEQLIRKSLFTIILKECSWPRKIVLAKLPVYLIKFKVCGLTFLSFNYQGLKLMIFWKNRKYAFSKRQSSKHLYP